MRHDDIALTLRSHLVRMTTTELEGASRVSTPVALMTAEEFLTYPTPPDKRVELVRGHLILREPPGLRHGECALRIAVALSTYLRADRESRGAAETRGRVVTCDSGFTLARNPDTVRGPDVAYVSRERWAAPLPDGFGEFAPDLAVEVRSPRDRVGELLAKVGDWLDAGAQLVWVADPRRSSVAIYRADGSQAVLGMPDVLEGEELLPGFRYPLAELFAA